MSSTPRRFANVLSKWHRLLKGKLPPSHYRTRTESRSQQKQPIEKEKLIDKVGALSTTLPSNGSSHVSVGKDTKKIGIIPISLPKSCYYNHFSAQNLT